MVSHLLAKARPAGREIVEVTPERAGWAHVGFRALRLADGETEWLETGVRELCIVVLTGRVDVDAGGQHFASLGTRDSVFDERSPAAVYVPPEHAVRKPRNLSTVNSKQFAKCRAITGARSFD